MATAFSPDGRWVAVASGEILGLWNLLDGSRGAILPVTGGLRTLDFLDHQPRLVAGDGQGALVFLRLENVVSGPTCVTAWRDAVGVHAMGCPACRSWSEVAADQLGRGIACPGCRTPLQINPRPIRGDWHRGAAAWAGPGTEDE